MYNDGRVYTHYGMISADTIRNRQNCKHVLVQVLKPMVAPGTHLIGWCPKDTNDISVEELWTYFLQDNVKYFPVIPATWRTPSQSRLFKYKISPHQSMYNIWIETKSKQQKLGLPFVVNSFILVNK